MALQQIARGLHPADNATMCHAGDAGSSPRSNDTRLSDVQNPRRNAMGSLRYPYGTPCSMLCSIGCVVSLELAFHATIVNPHLVQSHDVRECKAWSKCTPGLKSVMRIQSVLHNAW